MSEVAQRAQTSSLPPQEAQECSSNCHKGRVLAHGNPRNKINFREGWIQGSDNVIRTQFPFTLRFLSFISYRFRSFKVAPQNSGFPLS